MYVHGPQKTAVPVRAPPGVFSPVSQEFYCYGEHLVLDWNSGDSRLAAATTSVALSPKGSQEGSSIVREKSLKIARLADERRLIEWGAYARKSLVRLKDGEKGSPESGCAALLRHSKVVIPFNLDLFFRFLAEALLLSVRLHLFVGLTPNVLNAHLMSMGRACTEAAADCREETNKSITLVA